MTESHRPLIWPLIGLDERGFGAGYSGCKNLGKGVGLQVSVSFTTPFAEIGNVFGGIVTDQDWSANLAGVSIQPGETTQKGELSGGISLLKGDRLIGSFYVETIAFDVLGRKHVGGFTYSVYKQEIYLVSAKFRIIRTPMKDRLEPRFYGLKRMYGRFLYRRQWKARNRRN